LYVVIVPRFDHILDHSAVAPLCKVGAFKKGVSAPDNFTKESALVAMGFERLNNYPFYERGTRSERIALGGKVGGGRSG
jgi:hypothetical protein